MRNTTFMLAVVLLLSSAAGAQSYSGDSLALAPTAAAAVRPAPWDNTSLNLSLLPASASSPISSEFALPAAPEPAEPQGVQGVFANYDWQAYLGFTYVRFFEVPGTEVNTAGLNFGVVYYVKEWLGAEGEFTGAFGSQLGDNAKFLMGLGGVRVRHAMSRGIEVWAHALAGGAHYSPQTAYGKKGAFGYEVGGGVDINARRKRLAYRLAVDAAGTNFFGTYQVSPKISAGIVYKF
jgi:hypothetical protein